APPFPYTTLFRSRSGLIPERPAPPATLNPPLRLPRRSPHRPRPPRPGRHPLPRGSPERGGLRCGRLPRPATPPSPHPRAQRVRPHRRPARPAPRLRPLLERCAAVAAPPRCTPPEGPRGVPRRFAAGPRAPARTQRRPRRPATRPGTGARRPRPPRQRRPTTGRSSPPGRRPRPWSPRTPLPRSRWVGARRSRPTPPAAACRGRHPVRARPSRQTDHLPVLVDVDLLGRGVRSQTRHGPHLPADRVDEPGPDRGPHFPHRQRPPGGGADQRGV